MRNKPAVSLLVSMEAICSGLLPDIFLLMAFRLCIVWALEYNSKMPRGPQGQKRQMRLATTCLVRVA